MRWSCRLLSSLLLAAAVLVGGAFARPAALKLAFVSNNAFEFWTYAQRGAEKAKKELGIDLEFRRPSQGTAAEQRAIIEDLLTKGVKGIAVSPNDAKNQQDFYDEVAEKTALITVDSDLPTGALRKYYLGTDNFGAGQAAGDLVKKARPQGGSVIIFVGKLDVQNAIERRNGVIASLAGLKTMAEAERLLARGYPIQAGSHTILATMTDDAQAQRCKANAEDALVKYPDVGCLVGLWAYNPPALLAAVKDAKKEDKVAIVGFDENEETLQGVKDGHIIGTIVQDPFQFGYQSLKLLHALNTPGSQLPKDPVIFIKHRLITRDNVDAFKAECQKLLKGE